MSLKELVKKLENYYINQLLKNSLPFFKNKNSLPFYEIKNTFKKSFWNLSFFEIRNTFRKSFYERERISQNQKKFFPKNTPGVSFEQESKNFL